MEACSRDGFGIPFGQQRISIWPISLGGVGDQLWIARGHEGSGFLRGFPRFDVWRGARVLLFRDLHNDEQRGHDRDCGSDPADVEMLSRFSWRHQAENSNYPMGFVHIRSRSREPHIKFWRASSVLRGCIPTATVRIQSVAPTEARSIPRNAVCALGLLFRFRSSTAANSRWRLLQKDRCQVLGFRYKTVIKPCSTPELHHK